MMASSPSFLSDSVATGASGVSVVGWMSEPTSEPRFSAGMVFRYETPTTTPRRAIDNSIFRMTFISDFPVDAFVTTGFVLLSLVYQQESALIATINLDLR